VTGFEVSCSFEPVASVPLIAAKNSDNDPVGVMVDLESTLSVSRHQSSM
jgi:hypothetical protein